MKWKKYIVLLPIIILLTISIIYLPSELKIKQCIWSIIGLLIFILISNIKFNKILKYSVIYYIICIILLILVLVLNNFTNGSRGWLNIGFISFQPSELTKIALILFSIRYYNKLNIFVLILVFLFPMFLIFLEPDTGGVLIDGIILIFFILKKIKKKYLILLLGILTVITSIIVYTYINNKEIIINLIGPSIFYRIDRITNFLNDNSIQTTNAIVSIATGNTLYFPEMYNDFLIAYLLSNNIYLSIIIIISTILILVILKKKNTIISQIVFYLVLFQCWYNFAMNLKIVPVIGIPYLFLSYGGSHIISTIILIAIIYSTLDNMVDMDLHKQV